VKRDLCEVTGEKTDVRELDPRMHGDTDKETQV